MEETPIKTPLGVKVLWREAMRYGAILGLFTVVCNFLSTFCVPTPSGTAGSALFITILSGALWIIRTCGCIWLMVIFAKKLVASYDDVRRSHTFRLNMFTGFFSGLITAAFSLLTLKIKGSEALMEQMQEVIDSSQDPELARKVVELMTSPFIVFISTLAGCFLVGLLVSLVISRSVPKRVKNPFEQQ